MNALCGGWPVTNGFKDKQALNALDVSLERNSGWPTGRKAQGHGVCVVLVGAMPHQGAWESQVQGEGRQVNKGDGKAKRDASVFDHKLTRKPLNTGEPDTLKGVRPVRWGAVGNVLSYETTRRVFWQV